MAFPPVAIFIGGQQLEGYTGLTLTRSKEELTGSASIEVFFGYMPKEPVLVDVAIAKDIQIYIGGQLAFNGTVDRRNGEGSASQNRDTKGRFTSGFNGENSGSSSRSASIGPDRYTVTITARGKTKRLIDSSHQVNKTNLVKTNTREVLQKLVEPFNVPIEFLGTQVDLDKVRLRDGAKVLDEIRRVATENGYYIYETRDGKMRVTDDVGVGQGDALILGENILNFSASQDEEAAQSEITVKGQRTGKEVWGEEAILKNTTKVFKDSWVPSFSPVVLQHYGDGTEEALERRGRFEANKRSSRSKTISIDVFHVMAQGQPWDIGTLHYVEVPPEGIFDTFECTGLSYRVEANGTLETSLTLSPPSSGQKTTSGLDVFENAESSLSGAARRGQLGVTFAPGSYPSPWSGPTLTALAEPAAALLVRALSSASGLEAAAAEGQPELPPLSLPSEFEE